MSITMTQRTFKVELFQGDDLDRLSELRIAADRAKPRGQATGLEEAEYAAAAQAHDDFLAEARTRAVQLELKPVPRKAYQALLLEHPPREDDDGDAVVGANAQAIGEPLVKASIVSPALSDAEKQEFLDSLNNAQFTHLVDEALTINRVVFAPKGQLLASAPSPSSGETSDSPEA